jgi:chaperonin cofactor prefoldin
MSRDLDRGGSFHNTHYDLHDPKVKRVKRYFERAILLDGGDPFTLHQFARFLDKTQQSRQAENHFLLALEVDPSFSACYRDYSQFLFMQAEDECDTKLRRQLQDANLELGELAGQLSAFQTRLRSVEEELQSFLCQ